jgi:trehalose 6-phosphate phosphatase
MSDAAAEALRRFRQSVPSIDGLRVEKKDQSFAVHYRGVADEEETRAQLQEWLATLPDALDAIWGKKVVELRPEGLTKGTAVRRIAEEHPGHVPVYLGDDVTDEDAFEVLQKMDRETVTIKIGDDDTRAADRLDGPDAVMEYLRQYV